MSAITPAKLKITGRKLKLVMPEGHDEFIQDAAALLLSTAV